MKKVKEFKSKKLLRNNKKEENKDMPIVRGHYRKVSRTKKVRVRPHRREKPRRSIWAKW